VDTAAVDKRDTVILTVDIVVGDIVTSLRLLT
jgi:hypothetical protein